MMKSWPPAGRNYTEALRFYLKIQKFILAHLFLKFTDSRKVNAISTATHLPGWDIFNEEMQNKVIVKRNKYEREKCWSNDNLICVQAANHKHTKCHVHLEIVGM